MGVGLPPQGYFWWPGIETFLHGSFSFTHGITPSLCQIYIAPQLVWPAMTGNLEVNYLPGGSSCTFTDCILDFISIEREAEGRQVWGLHVLDRRWKWKDCGAISGNYNIRNQAADGDSEVFTPSLRPLDQLMRLCLIAMGEDTYGFDLSQVTEQTYPEVEWDYENPAAALLDLCDRFGYRVILTLQNRVLIAKANQGNYLPPVQFMSGATTLDPPNTPSAIIAVAGRSVIQFDFALVPMAMELDNTIVPLNLVSYTPQTAHGWGDADLPDFAIVKDPIAREYAKKSVFKYYQVGTPFDMPGISPTDPANDSIDDLMRILPLLDVQLVKAPPVLQPADANTQSPQYQPAQPLPAWVYGIWSTLTDESPNRTIDSSISKPDPRLGWYRYEFQIDGDQGLVIFDEYTFSFADDPPADGQAQGPQYLTPATLYLRTSCNLRDPETYGWLRVELQRTDLPTGQLQTKPMYVKTDDVAAKFIYTFSGYGVPTGVQSPNQIDVFQQATYMINAARAKLVMDTPQSYEYAGFAFIDLDGAIQQITWNVGDDGKATTQANRCKEDLVNTQSYAEKKQVALLQMALANKDKVGRIIKQDLSQNLTI
jgi:hypothetical protein